MDKRKFNLFAIGGLMLASTIAPTAANTTATIDENQEGSITLYKLISEDGKHIDGTGHSQNLDQVGQVGLKDVGFKFVKVGDLEQVTSPDDTKTGLYYTLTDEFVAEMTRIGVPVKATEIDGKDYYTAEDVNAALKSLNTLGVAYDNGNDGSGSGNEQMTEFVDNHGEDMPLTDENGMTNVSGLDLGLYMIAEVETPDQVADGVTKAVAKPSRPFLVAIPMTNITEVDGNPAGTVWQYDVTAYPKNEMIGIRKDIIADGNDIKDDECGETAVAGCGDGLIVHTDKNVGDTVNFLLTLDVPALQPQADGTPNTNRKYVVTDTMTKGLTLDDITANNFKLTVGTDPYNSANNKMLEHTTDYTVEHIAADADGNTGFRITLTTSGLAKFDELTADCQLFINYRARLNDDAVLADTGSIKEEGNKTHLVYGTSVSADRDFDSNEDVKVYTYEIDVTKTFSREIEDKSAVSFSIKSTTPEGTEEQLKFVKEDDGIYHLWDKEECAEADTLEVINVSKEGKLILKGLDARTYVVTEEDTVGGFNLMRDTITVDFTKAYPEDGTIDYATVQSGKDTPVEITSGLETGQINFEIKNNETITSLHTGGEGYGIALGLAGVAVVAAGGAVFFFTNKKKKAKK